MDTSLALAGLFILAFLLVLPGTAVAQEAAEPAPAADRRVALVTGSTSGLGREVARRLGSMGYHVIVHGRNAERGEALVREIEEEGAGSAVFLAADFASLEEVRGLARRVLATHDRLDLLVNNAGILGSRGGGRPVSAEGHELTFQVNYLSHFLLTELLLPLLRESAPSRVVNVASAAQAPIDFDDVMLEGEGAIRRAYAQSKLAQVMHAFDLAGRLAGTGVTANALHPATYMDTPMVRDAGAEPRTTVDEGADAVMRLLTEEVGSGRYFDGLEPARAHAQAYDAEARARLERLTRELVGLGPEGRLSRR